MQRKRGFDEKSDTALLAVYQTNPNSTEEDLEGWADRINDTLVRVKIRGVLPQLNNLLRNLYERLRWYFSQIVQ